MVAFDLDGTLLSRELEITASSVKALRRLRERGSRLVVATGRRFETAREHAERLGFRNEEPVICYGGSMVRRLDGRTLLRRALDPGLASEMLRWAESRGVHARILTDGEILLPPESAGRPTVLERLRSEDEPGVRIVDDLSGWLEYSGESPIRVVLVDSPDRVEKWLDEAREAFSGRAFVTRSLPHYVEVGALEGTKSRSLSFLCGEWGIDPARTAAFGDADNDADMLRFAGLGVAVGGTEEVRLAADAVAPPVEEDGVARFLEDVLDGCGTGLET
ncbi:Cof-type HAD-IIB family hydrolase [Rubrobacter aplysinae]|uniref:Cof-type HAD-IIB family hydrolase n=1 Tax=Rubrobacter aplysinae TaxID=909625 RepID=UPI00064C05E9|nr:Cof-type HAD-IIB family hydrolase [Rubrobacter aplysinae]